MVLLLLLSVTHLVNVSTSYTVSYTPRERESTRKRKEKRESPRETEKKSEEREPDVDIRYLYETAALSRSKQKIIKENVNLTTT